jgi:hypothetical protein
LSRLSTPKRSANKAISAARPCVPKPPAVASSSRKAIRSRKASHGEGHGTRAAPQRYWVLPDLTIQGTSKGARRVAEWNLSALWPDLGCSSARRSCVATDRARRLAVGADGQTMPALSWRERWRAICDNARAPAPRSVHMGKLLRCTMRGASCVARANETWAVPDRRASRACRCWQYSLLVARRIRETIERIEGCTGMAASDACRRSEFAVRRQLPQLRSRHLAWSASGSSAASVKKTNRG